jgi:hypothetical protein
MRFDGTMKPPTTPKLNQPRPFNQSAFQTVHFSDSPLFRPKQSAFQTETVRFSDHFPLECAAERKNIYLLHKEEEEIENRNPPPASNKKDEYRRLEKRYPSSCWPTSHPHYIPHLTHT